MVSTVGIHRQSDSGCLYTGEAENLVAAQSTKQDAWAALI